MLCCLNDDALPNLPPIPPIEKLEDVLDDSLSSRMLLEFAEGEHSSENVSFLLEVHELNMLIKLKTRLKRYFTRRSSMRDTGRKSDETRKRTTRSTDGTASLFPLRKEVELTKSIIRRHVATNNLCLTEKVGGGLREWLWDQDASASVPTELINQAYYMTFCTVKYDIFPRFKMSPLAQELLYVHLSRTLQHDALRDDFEQHCDSKLQAALAFWVEANKFTKEIADPRAKNKTLRLAVEIFDRHQAVLLVHCPDINRALKSSLAREKIEIFQVQALYERAQSAVQNSLAETYIKWANADLGKRHLADLGTQCSLKPFDQSSTTGHTARMVQSTISCDPAGDYTNEW